ncbi:TM0106 family RecB-like putative nuclease [Actinomycetes bacterium M1A6_2h]
MFVLGELLIHSASDLTVASDCEFRLLTVLDAHLGRIATDGAPDPMLERLSRLGSEHEQRVLREFRRRFGDGVVQIARPSSTRLLSEIVAARDATAAAMARRAPVIYQGTIFSETSAFLGFSDFLVLDGDSYRVYDTKLARHEQVSSILQIAAYADTLADTGATITSDAHLVLGDGTHSVVDLRDVLPVFRQARDDMVRLLSRHHDQLLPAAWDDLSVRACGRCEACTPQIERTRDLLLVAGLRSTQREALLRAGIGTIDALADATDVPNALSARTFRGLVAQASLQVRQERSREPVVEFFDPEALGSLPKADPGDVFFDFEGDPLWAEAGSADWGLEYLFGVVEIGDTPTGATQGHPHTGGSTECAPESGQAVTFRPFWAHDRASERQALIDFLDYVTERRRRFPSMHVYHYAPYEKTALLRLAGRHGVGEDIIDDMLRHRVLVDLYPVVKASLRVGARSYSIKKLEPLYMPDARDGEVQDAAASIVEYGNYCDLRDQGQVDAAQKILDEIAEYNRYDCESTLALRDWLLSRATEHGVAPHETKPVEPAEDERTELEENLYERAQTTGEHAYALLAAALGYHRREDKPFWWGHFDRLSSPVDEWADTKDTFVATAATTDGWQPPRTPRSRPRRTVRLEGRWAEGSSMGDKVHMLYETPAPEWIGSGDDPTVRWCTTGTVVDRSDDGTWVEVEESLKKVATEYADLPMALTPQAGPSSQSLADSIERTATEVQASTSLPDNAMIDLLRRIPPRGPLPRGEYRASVLAAVLGSDNSYVAVQGPPGTGKTHTGSGVIADLVNLHGWRIGIVAQSHAVVENMLAAVVDKGVPAGQVFKRGPGTEGSPWTAVKDVGDALGSGGGAVVGGTSWAFVKDTEFDQPLDLLVIEEAGQFSLANSIAVARNSQRLLLLGDPQQLPQVTQGRHPEPVDTSALDWLSDGHDTLPDDLGYFLARTWRMHPALCAPVSALAYDDRLESNAPERALAGVEPGVHTVLVAHEGNSTYSVEEADRVVTLVKSLMGKRWTDSDTPPRRLAPADVLVVAPYNAQVEVLRDALERAGFSDTKVGTVDKFQGRQAPVVILSMTASAIEDVPRGMSFLLSRNRLNVAISRGQWAAYIVRSPRLTEYLPSTPAGLPQLGAFLRLSPSR